MRGSKESDGDGKHCSRILEGDIFAAGGKNGVVMGDVVVGKQSW
jgi:hypothetical protein